MPRAIVEESSHLQLQADEVASLAVIMADHAKTQRQDILY